jgi:dTMP kinase
MRIGKLITLEGGEGSGKSTQIKKIYDYLYEAGIDVIVCREPGGVKISEAIRSVVLHNEHRNIDSLTELLLFIASRRQVVKEIIEPALKKGQWIICDRYTDSSVVYQGIARGLGEMITNRLNQLAVEWCVPCLTILLDVDIDEGLERAGRRGELNRLDCESLEFHKKVREGYLRLWRKDPIRIRKVDANQSLDDTFSEILTYIKPLLFGGAEF